MALAGRLGELEGALGERGQALQRALAARAGDFRELFDTRGEQLVETLSARGNQIAQEMTSVGEVVTQTIEGRGTAIVQHLGEKQTELTAAIEHSTADLRAAIETGAAASIGALVDTNEKLRAGMTEVINRLVNSSAGLQRAISATGTDFAAAEHSLSARMDYFRSIFTNVAGEINQLNQSTRAALDEASSLAETIARHKKSLASSAGDLSREQDDLDQILTARRDSLELLVNSIKVRREDLEGLMHSFAERIEDSFEKAATRARDIGAFLAESSQSTGGMIDRQFAGIRANIEQERESTASAMRAACEQANAELAGIFGQTTERFQSAAAELRDMSREIQRELEATREALRRGAADLPQETAQQAAAMRRAVADQIKALEALSEIVTRSGRAYDVSQPAPVNAERAAQPVPPRRVEPARAAEPPRAPEPPRPEAQRPRSAARPANAKTSERGGGWISDLLARADSDEPPVSPNAPAKPTQPAQRLEAISLDVARMIDHAAAAAAWDRYRRGETHAFSRQIYVGRGAQTFDEIRRRYRADLEFRATVDRYVQEFERLLAEVGQDEASEAVAKTYLLSETGKVYTLLAHAAGKLN
jgi:ABC-type transporter Mla subunit MlaD